MKNVQLITDGSCIGNPGPGGWACILRCGSEERELSGSAVITISRIGVMRWLWPLLEGRLVIEPRP
jgi:ribonuclease HI